MLEQISSPPLESPECPDLQQQSSLGLYSGSTLGDAGLGCGPWDSILNLRMGAGWLWNYLSLAQFLLVLLWFLDSSNWVSFTGVEMPFRSGPLVPAEVKTKRCRWTDASSQCIQKLKVYLLLRSELALRFLQLAETPARAVIFCWDSLPVWTNRSRRETINILEIAYFFICCLNISEICDPFTILIQSL